MIFRIRYYKLLFILIVIVLSCNIMVKSLARKSLGQYAGLPKNKETDRMNVTE